MPRSAVATKLAHWGQLFMVMAHFELASYSVPTIVIACRAAHPGLARSLARFAAFAAASSAGLARLSFGRGRPYSIPGECAACCNRRQCCLAWTAC